MRKRLVLIALTVLPSCRTSTIKSESKSIFSETNQGAEIISDASECFAKMGSSNYGEVFANATEMIKSDVQAKLKDNVQLRDKAITAIDIFKNDIDFKGVTDGAISYINKQKPEYSSILGYQLTSAIPTGMMIMFYHPMLKEIDVSGFTKTIFKDRDFKMRPYVGLVIVPTCVTTISAANNKATTSWRLRFGASFVGIWRSQESKTGAAETNSQETNAPSVTNVHQGLHVMGGFIWGSLYDPNQLRGPMFGFNGAYVAKRNLSSKVNLIPESKKIKSPKSGQEWNLVYRPMALWGYKDPRDAKDFSIKQIASSMGPRIFDEDSDFLIRSPSHALLLFDFSREKNEKSYIFPYFGMQLTSSELVEGIFDRPDAFSKTSINE
ncbi:MAG: hypothetical protein NT027_16900 [Proteobacteria bacterium]|nr:hypothetical protein [Pseudomonadota bacterium]